MIQVQEKDGENLTTLQPIPLPEDTPASDKSDSGSSDSESDQQGAYSSFFVWP